MAPKKTSASECGVLDDRSIAALVFTVDSSSVVFVEADAFDVVPRGGLMAEETLIHFGFLHDGGLHRNHLEVHHIVARRRLMALRA